MDFRGKYNAVSVAAFLINDVHPKMENLYQANDKLGEKINKANELQKFLNDLQEAARNYSHPTNKKELTIVRQNALDTILYNIQNSKKGQYNVANLFQRRGGTSFEREVADVFAAITKEVCTEMSINSDAFMIGSNLGNVEGIDAAVITEKIPQEFLQKINIKTQKVINKDTEEAKKIYYIADVAGKIDVSTNTTNLEVKAYPNQKLLEYYKLIEKANFSLKNYASMTWDKLAEALVEAVGRDKIHLGESSIVRSIYASLGKLGFDEDTRISAIFAGYNTIKRKRVHAAAVETHFYHLRYGYELAGYEITYGGISYGDVDYLIFNNPDGAIYVKSTAEILNKVITTESAPKGKGLGGMISISKEFFY